MRRSGGYVPRQIEAKLQVPPLQCKIPGFHLESPCCWRDAHIYWRRDRNVQTDSPQWISLRKKPALGRVITFRSVQPPQFQIVVGPNMISLQVNRGTEVFTVFCGSLHERSTNHKHARFMACVFKVSNISSHGLAPLLGATHEFVDGRHAAAINMDPELSSDEHQLQFSMKPMWQPQSRFTS